MRREEIRAGLEEVLNAIKDSEIEPALRTGIQKGARSETKVDSTLLGPLKKYAIASARFSAAANTIAEIMDMGSLATTELWAQILMGDISITHQCYQSVLFTRMQLPKLLELLHQKGVDEYRSVIEKGKVQMEPVEVLTVIVLETNQEFSKPERLVAVLEAGELLYQNCAIILGENPERLAVLSCDSGSDKSFDLLGAARVIEQVKELILGLWDKVVFFKEKHFAAQAEALTQGLAVFAKLTEMEATGKIGPEQAELIRRGLTSGCQKFLNAGAIIPEIRDHSHHEPRVLMAPEQKLLMAPEPGESGSSSSAGVIPPGEAVKSPSSEEGALLERLRRLEEALAQKERAESTAKGVAPRTRRKKPSSPTDGGL